MRRHEGPCGRVECMHRFKCEPWHYKTPHTAEYYRKYRRRPEVQPVMRERERARKKERMAAAKEREAAARAPYERWFLNQIRECARGFK